MAQMVKNLPVMQETRVRSLGWEVPLGKEMAIHSSILAWIIPWTEKSVGLQGVVTFSRRWQTRWLSGKESACQAGDSGSIPGLGRSPGNGSPLQYSCLDNSMDRGA